MIASLAIQFTLNFVMSRYSKIDSLWVDNIRAYCPNYLESGFFLNASIKRSALSFTGYGTYIGLLLSNHFFKGRQGVYSMPKDSCCLNFMRYLARLFLVTVMVAPWFALLYLSSIQIKSAWLDFFIESLLILAMTITPMLFLDFLSLKLGLYSREAAPNQARILTEENESNVRELPHIPGLNVRQQAN